LPAELAGKLRDADKQVMAWLERDDANAERFVRQPVEALHAAGVELSRAEHKLLLRLHEAAQETAVIPPGATVKVTATARKHRRADRGPDRTPAARGDDCAADDDKG
jgi:hypothetical protein